MLHAKGLEEPVSSPMNQNFYCANTSEEHSKALEVMREKLLRQVPILDEQSQLINLLLLENLLKPEHLTNTVVIMASGKATRLRAFTENCPKPMLRINKKRMLEISVKQCIASGF